MNNIKLQYQTVNPILRSVLERLMQMKDFDPFCLVGGTSLSLRYGHRMSDDIDLFTDAEYGSLDFCKLQDILRKEFAYCYGDYGTIVGLGVSYLVGNTKDDCVKLDLFYTDKFIRPITLQDNIRIASVDDIVAMKMDVLSHGGRKKDFWDLHLLHNYYSIKQMVSLYEERYPYGVEREDCIRGLINFKLAEFDPDPICMKDKVWQLIKLDFTEWVEDFEKATLT